MPTWFQPEELTSLAGDELVMTSFKWNVHNHGRTMNLKWLAEIVHSNPAWMNPETAAGLGLKDGDWIEMTSFQSEHLVKTASHLDHSGEIDAGSGRRIVSQMRVPIVTMQGLHPKVIAMSNSCGHSQYTNVAKADPGRSDGDKIQGMDTAGYRDPDWEQQHVVGRRIEQRSGNLEAEHRQRLESKPPDANCTRRHYRAAVVSRHHCQDFSCRLILSISTGAKCSLWFRCFICWPICG